MAYVVRAVRADEWAKVKALRLAALDDPAAPLAFLETREQAAERPDSFWQQRAAGAAQGDEARQFIAEAPDGSWVGTAVVLVERAGGNDIFGDAIARPQGHVVGVFVRAEHRGAGLADELFRAALDWAWSLDEPPLERVRLYVHERNHRAQAFYRRIGFEPTGRVVLTPGRSDSNDYEYAVARPTPTKMPP